jgi:hypothetical protein
MKTRKIIAALLVLIGFGSCANRPSKSKAPAEQPVVVTGSIVDRPILVMYGPPNRPFAPGRAIEQKAPEQPTTEQPTEADSNQSKAE